MNLVLNLNVVFLKTAVAMCNRPTLFQSVLSSACLINHYCRSKLLLDICTCTLTTTILLLSEGYLYFRAFDDDPTYNLSVVYHI